MLLYNRSNTDYKIHQFDRIAQLVIYKSYSADLPFVRLTDDIDSYVRQDSTINTTTSTNNDRLTSGFGSSGQ